MPSSPSNLTEETLESTAFDLLRVPGVGAFLRWRHSRTLLQVPLFLISVAMIAHGLFGPSLAPKNLATTLSWIHFRGLLILVLLCAGNFFCLACPFMLVRQVARFLFRPRFAWPRKLRNKWLSVALFVLILFNYELFGLWSSPWWTAWLIIAYFVTVLVVDGIFKHASFCKFVCPIGQFNFMASMISPLEVKVREPGICEPCKTKDCIRGARSTASELVVIQRGCELALFQPAKAGNMDCTFCLDCVHACPHDNVGILSRPPASELMTDPRRSGIGLFSRRKDLAALAITFTFGALLNAFGMITPVYAVERSMARALHIDHLAPILALIFTAFLVCEPVILLGGAAWLTRVRGYSRRGVLPLAVRYSYGLVPLGVGMWLAHYGFHFLTGFLAVAPLVQSTLASLGFPILGEPQWTLTGMPKSLVLPMEMGFLFLGLLGSLTVSYRLAEEDAPEQPYAALVPWAVVSVILWIGAMWLITQPMDMRGTFVSG